MAKTAVWQKGAISTSLTTLAIEKLEKIHSKLLLLKKNEGRFSESQQKREQNLTNNLISLFDIALANALDLIKIKEDWDFLTDQLSNHKIYLGNIDKEFIKKQEKILHRKQKEEE